MQQSLGPPCLSETMPNVVPRGDAGHARSSGEAHLISALQVRCASRHCAMVFEPKSCNEKVGSRSGMVRGADGRDNATVESFFVVAP